MFADIQILAWLADSEKTFSSLDSLLQDGLDTRPVTAKLESIATLKNKLMAATPKSMTMLLAVEMDVQILIAAMELQGILIDVQRLVLFLLL